VTSHTEYSREAHRKNQERIRALGRKGALEIMEVLKENGGSVISQRRLRKEVGEVVRLRLGELEELGMIEIERNGPEYDGYGVRITQIGELASDYCSASEKMKSGPSERTKRQREIGQRIVDYIDENGPCKSNEIAWKLGLNSRFVGQMCRRIPVIEKKTWRKPYTWGLKKARSVEESDT